MSDSDVAGAKNRKGETRRNQWVLNINKEKGQITIRFYESCHFITCVVHMKSDLISSIVL